LTHGTKTPDSPTSIFLKLSPLRQPQTFQLAIVLASGALAIVLFFAIIPRKSSAAKPVVWMLTNFSEPTIVSSPNVKPIAAIAQPSLAGERGPLKGKTVDYPWQPNESPAGQARFACTA